MARMDGDRDQQFGPVFWSDGDPHDDALLGFDPLPWELYVFGYKEAADALIREMLERNGPQDVLVYPTIFLYRHFLELRIKDVHRKVRRLLKRAGTNFKRGHHIDELWAETVELLKQLPDDFAATNLEFATHVIEEFARLDKRSTLFRYADEMQGPDPLGGLTRVDMRRVAEMVRGAARDLAGLAEWLAVEIEAEIELTRRL